jgi:hypothetical protein
LLCVPGFMKPAAAAKTLHPEVSLRPTPMPVTESTGVFNGSPSSRTSALLSSSRSASQSSLRPAPVPLPTPPVSEP